MQTNNLDDTEVTQPAMAKNRRSIGQGCKVFTEVEGVLIKH